jgi:hypothetical protein
LYYRQILETIERAPESTLVIGNEGGDMVAGQLGCQTFLIAGAVLTSEPVPPPTFTGSLADLERLLRG